MKTDPNALAFPYEEMNGQRETYRDHFGLSVREHFAVLAMQGAMSNPAYFGLTTDRIADLAVSQADALISSLNKEVQK